MKKLGLLFIIIGIGVTSFPLIQQWVDVYLQEKMLNEMDFLGENSEEDLDALGAVFDDLNASGEDANAEGEEVQLEGYEDFTDIGEGTEAPTSITTTVQNNTAQTTTVKPKPVIKLKALGRIEIPVVKIKMPIVEGTGVEALRRSAGHLTGTDMPGEIGNSVIAGHRGYSEGRLFNRLDELKVGDKIIVTTKKGKFTYEVYETKIVKPTDLSVLNRNSRDKVLTLITCTPMFKSTHRIIIHAVMR